MTTEAIRPATRHQRWYKILYVQVLIAIALGILIGYFYPDLGKALKPLGDGFIALIKMMIAPVIFCTVVHGISSMGDLKRVGRVGLKALIYFETVSTVALAIGLDRPDIRHRLRHQGEGRGHRRPSARDNPRQLFWGACPRRSAAGPADLDPFRFCHRLSR
jgi:Sodium:dicarboxylate symporter family